MPKNKNWIVATRNVIEAKHPDAVQEADQRLVQCMLDDVKSKLSKCLRVEWRQSPTMALQKAFASAQGLYRLLTAQSAVYKIEMLPAKYHGQMAVFRSDLMVDMDLDGTGDDVDLTGTALILSVFPTVLRVASSDGDSVSRFGSESVLRPLMNVQAETTVVVSKARVVPNKSGD